jgi:protein-S-isoprenylcysteine O-methyltransferase Ste14
MSICHSIAMLSPWNAWLSNCFGDPYRTYRREVRALVPCLY